MVFVMLIDLNRSIVQIIWTSDTKALGDHGLTEAGSH
jgi:hypothetical protein